MSFLRRRRDGTGIVYDLLYLTLKSPSKTRIRRELGLTFRQSRELLDFLVEKEYLARESRDGNAVRYSTSKEGYCLLYYLSMVHEKLAGFFPQRKGRIFSGLARAEVERELTEMLFSFSPSVSSLNGLSSHNVTTL